MSTHSGEPGTLGSSRDWLLRGATLVTMDPEAQVLRGADLLVEGGRIREIGSVSEKAGVGTRDLTGKIVLPGLIQGHIHLGQSLFRALAEERRLLAWLAERIYPLEAAHDAESAYWSGALGAAECLLSGTTTIQDIGIGPGIEGLVQAIADSGLRALVGPCLMDSGPDLPAALSSSADEALNGAVALADEIEKHPRLSFVLNPRFILSCSDALWDGIRFLAEEHSWPVHTHALEQREETEEVRALKGGRDEIHYFDDAGILDLDLRLAHGVWLEQEHLDTIAGARVSVVHCPSSNLKLGSGLADLVAMRDRHLAIGIGCDGTPCNNDLDAFEELRLAALVQSVKHAPGALKGVDALRLATSEGARAIGLEDEIGSLEVGKAADLVVLDGERLDLWAAPEADVHDVIAFGASRAAVREVMVEGEWLVEDGALSGRDLGEIRASSDRAWRALRQRAGLSL